MMGLAQNDGNLGRRHKLNMAQKEQVFIWKLTANLQNNGDYVRTVVADHNFERLE
jgi:hypothetical protein